MKGERFDPKKYYIEMIIRIADKEELIQYSEPVLIQLPTERLEAIWDSLRYKYGDLKRKGK